MTITPDWLAGFVDAEGCFCLSFRQDKGVTESSFLIKQHAVDSRLMEAIQRHLGVGRLYVKGSMCSYYVKARADLRDTVLPSFKGRLGTSKNESFNLMRQAFSMKPSPIRRKLGPEWLRGFVDGEGSFYITIVRNSRSRLGHQIRIGFGLSQTQCEVEVLKAINNEFFGGRCLVKFQAATNSYLLGTENAAVLHEEILPFFQRHPLLTRKGNDLRVLLKASDLMLKEEHLRPDAVAVFEEMRRMMRENRTVRRHDEDIVHA